VTQVVREVKIGTLETLNMEVNNEVERAARHVFNISHQYKAITYLKDNMNEDEILLHMDFSENYSCKLNSEIQSMHFGASQRQKVYILASHTQRENKFHLRPFQIALFITLPESGDISILFCNI